MAFITHLFRKIFSSRKKNLINAFAGNGHNITVLEKVTNGYMNNATSVK